MKTAVTYLLSDHLKLTELEHTTVPTVGITGIIEDRLLNNQPDTSYTASFVTHLSTDKGGTPVDTSTPSVVNNVDVQDGGN